MYTVPWGRRTCLLFAFAVRIKIRSHLKADLFLRLARTWLCKLKAILSHGALSSQICMPQHSLARPLCRYRYFDLFSRPAGHVHQTIQAYCSGVPFRISSSKDVPPLCKSTELTNLEVNLLYCVSLYFSANADIVYKPFARHGVRVNVREQERKPRKKRGN